MKKIISLLVLMLFVFTGIKAQQQKEFIIAESYPDLKSLELARSAFFSKKIYTPADNDPDKDYDFYMRRSKDMRTVGLITLGGGLVFAGIGLIYGLKDNPTDGDQSTFIFSSIAGGALGIASIPFMISAYSNRNKAKLVLSKQNTGFGLPSKVSRGITGITLAICIGK
ncbi:MAG TPA: hypothetical protein VK484_04885 [Ferruginibacter sp.]|nr:hypothetical protein [Ferruginibacter sp.]